MSDSFVNNLTKNSFNSIVLLTGVTRKRSMSNFPKNEHWCKKRSFFSGKFGVHCFLVSPVLRFALLPYCLIEGRIFKKKIKAALTPAECFYLYCSYIWTVSNCRFCSFFRSPFTFCLRWFDFEDLSSF